VLRIDDAKRQPNSHSGIDGVSPLPEHIQPDLRGEWMDGGDGTMSAVRDLFRGAAKSGAKEGE